jgi:putative nucleotidyltransferase with HDIG domain
MGRSYRKNNSDKKTYSRENDSPLDIAGLLEKTHFETIMAFSEALEARDQYTAGHSRRVMEYSKSIGQRFKLDKQDIEDLKRSALLHDIGKIGIPDTILKKETKLTDEEYAIIKSHSGTGAGILQYIKSFKHLVPAVYHHHERFDGEGYPDCIKGEAIPLHARIIAIADTFDAMTSSRSYRKKALSLRTALSELERNKGTQFDPGIADVFIEILEESPFYFTRFREPEYHL